MKTIAMIPARYAATRFRGKLMEMLGNKTIIRHTYENTVATRLFDEVAVVTDSDIIFNEIVQNGGYAIKSRAHHESGSDRIAEAVEEIDVEIVVNVQGDEPFVKKSILSSLLEIFEDDHSKKIQVASPMRYLTPNDEITDPNLVKVVVDKEMNALYFSRSVIPYSRDTKNTITWYKHIGIYAFRKKALLNFARWEMTPLENAEKLESLRYLENGVSIKMVISDEAPVSIDTPADLEKAKAAWKLS